MEGGFNQHKCSFQYPLPGDGLIFAWAHDAGGPQKANHVLRFPEAHRFLSSSVLSQIPGEVTSAKAVPNGGNTETNH